MGVTSPSSPFPASRVFHVAVAHGVRPVAIAASTITTATLVAMVTATSRSSAATSSSPAIDVCWRGGCRVDERAGQLLLRVEEQPEEADDQLTQLHDGQHGDAHPQTHRAADIREQVGQAVGWQLSVLHHA